MDLIDCGIAIISTRNREDTACVAAQHAIIAGMGDVPGHLKATNDERTACGRAARSPVSHPYSLLSAASRVTGLAGVLRLPARSWSDGIGTRPGVVRDAGIALIGARAYAGSGRAHTFGSRLGGGLISGRHGQDCCAKQRQSRHEYLFSHDVFSCSFAYLAPDGRQDGVAGTVGQPQKSCGLHFTSPAHAATWREYRGRVFGSSWSRMRDLFENVSVDQPTNPMEAARRAMRPALRQRFYEAATVEAGEGGHRVLLDGKPVRTPARHVLAAPTIALAKAIAAEWAEQGKLVDPARMPLTRLANTIIDGVAAASDPIVEEIAKYLASDLVFYRAEAPDRLVERQSGLWDPVLGWAREAHGARFILAAGVIPVEQPEVALAAVRGAIPREPWRLGATHSVTTLTGSALIALALAHGALSTEQAWEAAHVDEDWNMEQWGRDELALERRRFRLAEMAAAATVLKFA
jgi:chaperone required for assembly of F1-ATPase